MLTMTGEPTGSTIELNWLPPLHPNGAIHYEIEYEPAVTPGDPVNAGNSSSPYFTLTLPNEFLTYNVRVAAVNTQGQAQSSNVLSMCPRMKQERGMFVCSILHTRNYCRYEKPYNIHSHVFTYIARTCIVTVYFKLKSIHLTHMHPAMACNCVSAGVGSFFGGVLLTAAIAGGVAAVVLYATKRRLSVKSDHE